MRYRRQTTKFADKRRKPAPIALLCVAFAALLATVITIATRHEPKTVRQVRPPSQTSGELLEDAAACIERRDLAGAEKILHSLLQRDAGDSTAWLYLGHVARQRGDVAQAIEAWQRIPDFPAKVGATARYLEATVLLENSEARRAEEKLLQSTNLNPLYLQPHERLLELYVLQMRKTETRGQLDRIQNLRALTLDELILQISAGNQISDTEQAIGYLQSFIAADPDDVASRVALARYLIAAARYEDAVQLLSEMLGHWPDNQQARGVLVESLLKLDRIEQAESLLKDHQPDGSSPLLLWRSAGELASAQGDLPQATKYFERVVKMNPDDRPMHYRLGLLFRQLGQEQDAQTHLEKAVLMDRLRQQTRLVSQAKRKRIDLLIPVIVEVGDTLLRLGRHAEAARWYQQSLSLDPQESAALVGLERAHRALQLVVTNAASQQETATLPASGDRQPSSEPKEKTIAQAGNNQHSQAQAKSPNLGPIKLRDVHQQVGLNFNYFNGQTGFKYLIESMGGGVAVLDFDADGWPDLYFPQGCPLPVDTEQHSHTDRLFRNENAHRFSDVTKLAGLANRGYGQGCVAGDFNNDGFVDLIVANFGRNVAYRNNGDGTFTDVTDALGLEHERMSSSLALADLDRDGDLDLYVVNYCVDSSKVCRNEQGEFITCSPESFAGEQDELYLNRGDGRFEDATVSAGVIAADGKGLGVVTADLDGDAWPDIYVANDTTPNFLFQNQGKGASSSGQVRLVEKGLISGTAMSSDGRAEAGMGVACADLNGDSQLDLFVTNYFMESNTAYFNQGNAFFAAVSREQGLAAPSLPLVGFGTQAVDLDLDGWLDLLVANGHIDDFGDEDQAWKMPPQLFHNLGGGRFEEVSEDAGKYFQGRYLGRGVARLDWNRDGRPDLVVVHQDASAALLKNETATAGHAVVLELHGVASNRDAIGARIRVSAGGVTQMLEICGGDGFLASNERRQFVGLGYADKVDAVEVDWPSGRTDKWQELPADCRLILVEGREPITRLITLRD